MKYNILLGFLILILGLSSCATKKEIFYVQDIEDYDNTEVFYVNTKIQVNDILKITVGALVEETAIPYNRNSDGNGGASIQLMQLQGYLVSKENTIIFEGLGSVSTKDKTPSELEKQIAKELEDGGFLINPSVNVRIINAKVTVLGEVKSPGVYTFTEQNITFMQALGYAGDLTINGKRDDIKIIREVDGNRQITTIDLTNSEFLNSEFYQIKPNDVIVVNPNGPKVKSAGFVGNVGTLISVISILFTTVVLITR